MENGLPEGGHQGIWDPDHCEDEAKPGTLIKKQYLCSSLCSVDRCVRSTEAQ